MSLSLRFLADMGISPRCVEWLRMQGHDALHLFEQKLHMLSDGEILLKAKNEQRILLTMDLDFAQLISKAGTDDLPTVIIFRLNDQRPQNVYAKLTAILPDIGRVIKQCNSIFSVSDNKVRIRRLPIKNSNEER